MVGINTAKKWNLKEFPFIYGDPNDQNEVTKIFSIVCRKFYGENPHEFETRFDFFDYGTDKLISNLVRLVSNTNVFSDD